MFCPRCATENDSEPAYCRQCGLSLSDLRLALDGVPTESLNKLKSGSHLMNGGIATLTVFMLFAVVIALLGTLQGHPVLIAVAMLNALLGALIGLPLVIAGKVRVGQASRLLSSKDSKRSIDSQRIQNLNDSYESKTNRLPPASVTEHTTLNLNSHHQSEIGNRQDAD
jgi:hypothetical protein